MHKVCQSLLIIMPALLALMSPWSLARGPIGEEPGVSAAQDAEVEVSVGTNFFGLGLLKKSTNNPCDTATRRDTEFFWICHSSVIDEKVLSNDVQIRLTDGKFFLEKDLSKSLDREYDELMMVVDVLPKLVSFSCYPESSIDRIRLPIGRELEMAELVYSGDIKKTLFSDDTVAGWQLSAFDVYAELNNYCQYYFCEFAVVRNSSKFWECNEAILQETAWLGDYNIQVSLKAGELSIEQALSEQVSPTLESAISNFGRQTAELIVNIACHPTERLVDIAFEGRSKFMLSEALIQEVTKSISFEEDRKMLSSRLDAYGIYTNKLATSSCS